MHHFRGIYTIRLGSVWRSKDASFSFNDIDDLAIEKGISVGRIASVEWVVYIILLITLEGKTVKQITSLAFCEQVFKTLWD